MDAESPQLAPFQAADLPELARMNRALYRHDDAGQRMTPGKLRATARMALRDPELVQIHMVRLGGRVVGYAITTRFWSNEFGGRMLVLDELFVKRSCRGRGLGTLVVQALFDLYRSRAKACLLEVARDNDRARALYERLGFVVAGRHFLLRKLPARPLPDRSPPTS